MPRHRRVPPGGAWAQSSSGVAPSRGLSGCARARRLALARARRVDGGRVRPLLRGAGQQRLGACGSVGSAGSASITRGGRRPHPSGSRRRAPRRSRRPLPCARLHGRCCGRAEVGVVQPPHSKSTRTAGGSGGARGVETVEEPWGVGHPWGASRAGVWRGDGLCDSSRTGANGMGGRQTAEASDSRDVMR